MSFHLWTHLRLFLLIPLIMLSCYEEQTKAICGGGQAELFPFSINLKTEAKITLGLVILCVEI